MLKLKYPKERILLFIIEAVTKKFEKINRQLVESLHTYSVTGLKNRKYLFEFGDKFLKEEKYNTLAVVDIRNLRKYNEIFGHETTDKILKAIADEILNYCGEHCFIGNLDSGRFWILTKLEGETEEELLKEAIPKVEGLINKLTRDELNIVLNEEELTILVSLNVGIAFYPFHGENIRELLQNAEIATDRAKEKGINVYEFFNEEFKKHIEENIWIEEQLRKAVRENKLQEQIEPYFQIKVSPKGEITGVEILLRWFPEGWKEPYRFTGRVIQVAEQTGLINDLFKVILEKSIPVMEESWRIKPSIHFGLNLSPQQLALKEELKEALNVLKEKKLPIERIELEVIETEFLKEANLWNFVNELKEMGFSLVIDDFGKGYSSFDRIKIMEIDGVKIDKSLVEDIPEKVKNLGKDIKEYKFLGNLIRFLKNMGYKITVEGVENEDMVNLLRDFEIDEYQGFYFAKPVDAQTYLDCLKHWENYKRCFPR